jgi:hypothetical protein
VSGAAAPVPPEGVARRDVLTAGVVAAGALLAAGCGASRAPVDAHPATPRTAPSPAAASADVPILRAALQLERRTVAAYTAGIPLLDRARARWAKVFLAEELQHTGELISLLRLAGATAPPPAASYAIGHPRDGDGVVAVLESLEALQLAGYARWIPRLSPGTMRAGAASLFANDAQHITALRAARGRPALGSPWVVGRPGAVQG